MKNKLHLLLSIAFVIVCGYVFAQTPMINFESERGRIVEVTKNDFETTRVDFTFEGLNFFNVKTEQGYFTELVMPFGYSVGELGTPKLPAQHKLVEIPFGADVHVEVISYTTREYKLADLGVQHPLMPVQPSIRKDQDIRDVPFEYQPSYYAKTTFLEPELASIEVLGVMRGQRIARLTVAPVQYNPEAGTIRVFNDVEVEIQYSGADEALTRYIKASTYSPYFDVVYNYVINPFNNRDLFDDHPDLTRYPIKMVIVSHDDFEETLQPFIEWKTIQGFDIIEAYTSEVGSTAAAIQNFIHAQYDAATPEDPAPTFVMVVGDPTRLPASATGSASNQVTDLYYGSVDGDMFPEMYVGRLSARNVQELQNQLDKILYYQQYQFEDPSYLNDVTLIAGSDGFWNPQVGQPTVHYGTQNYFNTANGFTNVNAFLSSYAGVYDEERIAVSLINFTAHCSPTSWAGPNLSVSDVHNMTNTNRYPLAIGNCCQSALFSHPESIGEAWVRAGNKGAVAYIGSAPNTHWFEDFYWAVGAFPIQGNNGGYVPTVEETTMGAYDSQFVGDYHAVASTKLVGNLALTQAHIQNYPTHSSALWYWQGYHTFGDPSTIIYFTEGSENVVSHMPIVPIGLDTYTVEALPGSYVAVSKNGVLHGAAFVGVDGEVEVPIDPILDGGDVTIAVTKPQYIPYIVEVPAAALEGPFVVIDNYLINDPDGTQQANYGQSFTIDLTLKNVGADPVEEVTATLSGDDDYITLENAGEAVTFDPMNAGDTGNTATVADAFSFQVSMDVPNQHMATFILTVTDGEDEWTSNLRITANAPVLTLNAEYVIDDSEHGDGNGRLDPGEEALLIFELTNHGNTDARYTVVSLHGNSPYFTIEENEMELEPVTAGETIAIAFNVSAHPSTIDGTPVNLEVVAQDAHAYELHTELFIGQLPELTLGDGNQNSHHYPFYNFYRANRSQMIYMAGELGAGEKTITEMAFEITNASTSHNQLPNFYIRMMHTDASSFGNNFINTDNAQVVYHANPFVMPLETGMVNWELQEHFEYNGSSNLLVEVVWGQLPNWTSNFYRVASTETGGNTVAFGYSDWVDIPAFNGTASIRPNLWLAFAADAPEDTHDLHFVVSDQHANTLEEAAVTIGSLTKLTGQDGSTGFNLLPGVYNYRVHKNNFQPYDESVNLDDDKTVEVVLSPLDFAVTFKVNLTRAIQFGLLDGFDYNQHHIFITGDMTSWSEPGDDLDNQMMERISSEPMVYSIVHQLMPGVYEYKYFSDLIGDGWDGGEWPGDPNRSIEVIDDAIVVEEMFGPSDLQVIESHEIVLNLFPNPARTNLTVEANEAITGIRMIDMLGQVVYTTSVANEYNHVISVTPFRSGVYFVQVTTSGGVITSRVQITR